MDRAALTGLIKREGRALGFDLVGVSAVAAPLHAESFAAWLRRGFHGEMAYLERTAEARLDPAVFLPWARSIVSVALLYDTPEIRTADRPGARGWISRYAWGQDYHAVMQAKLDALLAFVRATAGADVQGRGLVDAGPVLDRAAAARAGIGWYGKNTNLLSMQLGSFFFLGELFLSVELAEDRPVRDRCGECRLCLDACPTHAFVGPYLLDARRCISYLTIELKGPIPRDLRPLVGAHIFGCDICQDVCPYNTRVHPAREAGFRARPELIAPELVPLLGLTEAEFRARFAGSPILRAKRRGFLRNVCVALGNVLAKGDRGGDEGQRTEAVSALARALAEDPEPLVRGHAAWALGRIGAAAATLHQAAAHETDPWVREELALGLNAAAD